MLFVKSILKKETIEGSSFQVFALWNLIEFWNHELDDPTKICTNIQKYAQICKRHANDYFKKRKNRQKSLLMSSLCPLELH